MFAIGALALLLALIAFGPPAASALGLPLPVIVASIGLCYGIASSFVGESVSGLALDTVLIVGDQQLATAAGYLVVTLGAGLAATVAGRAAARRTTDGGPA